jgi:starch synthase
LRDGVATGFQFTPVEAGPLQHALLRACDLFDDQPRWQQLQRRAMGREVGWSAAAERYVSLYERMLRERAR